jgi:hypothetical protein
LDCVDIDFWMAAQRLPILSQNRNIKHRRLLERGMSVRGASLILATPLEWALSSNLQIREPPQKETEGPSVNLKEGAFPVDEYVKPGLSLEDC